MGTVIAGLTESIASIADDVMSAIGSILPYALPIVGAVLVVTIGIKVFKKVSGK